MKPVQNFLFQPERSDFMKDLDNAESPDAREILDEITIADMPNGDLHLVAQVAGVNFAVRLLKDFAGMSLSIPKYGFKKIFSRYVKKHFDGTNAKVLARRLGVTERFIYTIYSKED